MIVDNAFIYVVATYIMLSNGIEPRSVDDIQLPTNGFSKGSVMKRMK